MTFTRGALAQIFSIIALILVPVAATAQSGDLPPTDLVLRASVQAVGGMEKFARLKRIEIDRRIAAPDGAAIAADRITGAPPYLLTQYVDGENAPRRTYDSRKKAQHGVNAERLAANRSFFWREWWMLYARFAGAGLGEVFITARTDADREPGAIVLDIQPRDADAYRLILDAATHLPQSREFDLDGAEIRDVFSDYRPIGGLFLPHRITSFRNGERTEEISLDWTVDFARGRRSSTEQINEILETAIADKGMPGVSALVMQGDKIVFEKSYGFDSLEFQRPASDDSVYVLASISKIVAGATAMVLHEKGLLDLDAPITAFFDNVPQSHAAITVRHLLNHSHGLQEVIEDVRGPAKPQSHDELLGDVDARRATAFSSPLNFEPGASWRYSQIGFEILQTILEKSAGKPYEAIVAIDIFAPLAMTSAAYGASDTIVPQRLPMNYAWDGDRLVYNYLNFSRTDFTAAGLNATVRDLGKFYRAVAKAQLISPTARDEMWRETTTNAGDRTYYALGWDSYRSSRNGRRSVGHSGGGSGWTRYFPEEDLTVIVVSNLNGARADRLVFDIADAFFRWQEE